MRKSHQNKVPEAFESFYAPQLKLKKLLQSGSDHIDDSNNEAAVAGLMVLHYVIFLVCALSEHDELLLTSLDILDSRLKQFLRVINIKFKK